MWDNPIGAMLANKAPAFARKSRLACEIRGWAVKSAVPGHLLGCTVFRGSGGWQPLPPPEICRTVPLRVRPAREARTAGAGFRKCTPVDGRYLYVPRPPRSVRECAMNEHRSTAYFGI
jgi:hypothetical protein